MMRQSMFLLLCFSAVASNLLAEETNFYLHSWRTDKDEMVCVLVPESMKDLRLIEEPNRVIVRLDADFTKSLADPFRELELLHVDMENYRSELHLTDSQMAKMSDAVKMARAKISSIVVGIQTNRLSMEKARRFSHEFAMEIDDVKSDSLVDFQIVRISELRNQGLFYVGMIGWLQSKPVRDELEIDDKQIESMKTLYPELEQEFIEEIIELSVEYREKILNELSEQQRAELKAMTGEKPTVDFRLKFGKQELIDILGIRWSTK